MLLCFFLLLSIFSCVSPLYSPFPPFPLGFSQTLLLKTPFIFTHILFLSTYDLAVAANATTADHFKMSYFQSAPWGLVRPRGGFLGRERFIFKKISYVCLSEGGRPLEWAEIVLSSSPHGQIDPIVQSGPCAKEIVSRSPQILAKDRLNYPGTKVEQFLLFCSIYQKVDALPSLHSFLVIHNPS